MRPERFYTIKRPAKRLPDRPMQFIAARPSSKDIKTTRRFRSYLWSITKIAGPLALSITALTISFLAYIDQHQANKVAENSATIADNSAQRQQAELVSFLQEQNLSNRQVVDTIILVNNASDAPIYNAVFNVTGQVGKAKILGLQLYLGNVPACSSGRIASSTISEYLIALTKIFGPALVPSEPSLYKGKASYDALSMYFTDNSGISWLYTEGQPLQQVRYPPKLGRFFPLRLPPLQYEPATGCS
jgi:hypothetical protein